MLSWRCGFVAMILGALLSVRAVSGGTFTDGTAFTYQGTLQSDGEPVSGLVDVRFRLYDQLTGGTQRGTQVVIPDVPVSDGIFAVELDFGPEFYGASRWLEVAVRFADGGAFATLSPRQAVYPAPSAQFAGLAGIVTWDGVVGKPGGFGDGVDDTVWSLNLDSEAYYLAGNVGIGLDDPAHPFEVLTSRGAGFRIPDFAVNETTGNQVVSQFVSEAGGVTLRLLGVDGMGAGIGTTVALEHQTGAFSIGNQFPAQVTLSFDGKLGVGTTVPAAAMHIQDGSLWIGGDSGGNLPMGVGSGLRLWNEAFVDRPVIAGFDYDTMQPVDLLLQPDGGSVGIRTLNPDAMLSIANIGGANGAKMIGFGEGEASGFWFGSGFSGTDGDNYISLSTNIGGLGPIMNWKGNGRVGIGTTAPSARLDVRSSASNSTVVNAENTGSGAASVAVRGKVNSGYGVYGEATATGGTNYGVFGAGGTSPAAYGVFAAGRIGAAGTKTFMIDHPADPEGQFLIHYSMESPEPQNVYNGTTILDANGEAQVRLPGYFELINTDFHYQLTAIGAPAPLLHVASEITDGVFVIAGGQGGMKVCWEVKARRNDRFVQRMGAPVEVRKGAAERGLYLMPELYDQPREKALRPMSVQDDVRAN